MAEEELIASIALDADEDADGERFENRLALYRYDTAVGLNLEYRNAGGGVAWSSTEEIGIPNEHLAGLADALFDAATRTKGVHAILQRERHADDGDAVATLTRILRERDAYRDEANRKAEAHLDAGELVDAIDDFVSSRIVAFQTTREIATHILPIKRARVNLQNALARRSP